MSASASEAIALLLASPGGYLFAAVWGALWGSFWNVAIHRLAREDASLGMLVRPPSHCPHCNTPIRAFDNVPLVGWLLLGGRCRSCKAPISVRYPLVEAAGLGFGLAVYQLFVLGHPDEVALMLCRFFVYFFFVGTLFVLAAIDLDTFLLPDAIVLPAIPVFFLGARVIGDVSLVDALIGAGAGWAIFKSLEILYPLFSRWRRRRRLARQAAAEGWSAEQTRQALEEEQGIDGVGGGDAKLMALIGGVLGWRSLPFTLGLGSMIGVAVVAPRLLTTWLAARTQGNTPEAPTGVAPPAAQSDESEERAPGEPEEARSLGETEIPYGPFLVAGALCYLFLRDLVWAWMMGWVDAP